MSYSDDIYKEILLEHIENPKNKNKNHTDYLSETLKNPSCGDIITVYVLKENNKVKDITYDVSGCSLCIASASIMSDILLGKEIKEAENIISEFNNMVTNKPYDKNVLKDAVCLNGVSEIPARIKCVTLGYKAFEKIVMEHKDEGK